jgi:hypothetical protein
MSHVLRERVIGMLTAGISTRAVPREFNVNSSTICRLNVILENLAVRTTGLTRRPCVTTAAQDPPHPPSSPAGWSETSHPDSWWNWVCTTKEFLHKLSNLSVKLICMCIVLTSVLTCSSRINPTFNCAWQTACVESCGQAVCWCQQNAPWWGYGMGRHKLQTINTITFY